MDLDDQQLSDLAFFFAAWGLFTVALMAGVAAYYWRFYGD